MYTGAHVCNRLPFFCCKVMIREYRSPKTSCNVELAVNSGQQKTVRIDLGLFMLKAYPKIETTFQITNLNEYATYTDTVGHSSSIITYTNPRRPIFYINDWQALLYWGLDYSLVWSPPSPEFSPFGTSMASHVFTFLVTSSRRVSMGVLVNISCIWDCTDRCWFTNVLTLL